MVVLEKDGRVACQQSTHNSGVLHAGLYYKPGSEKAKLCVGGLRQMIEFCQQHHVAHEVCGKVVIATEPEELPRLERLYERGIQNGLEGLRKLTREEIREIEPHAAGIAGVRVPQEGIVDYRGVADALVREIERMGGKIVLRARVLRGISEGSGYRLVTAQGEILSKQVINCAGLHSDQVVEALGQKRPARIIPFRGEYFQIKAERQHLVKHLIYPVPDPTFPFLGVHFTRMVQGGVEAGPNAVLAFAREGYRKSEIHGGELWDALSYGGLWRFMGKHAGMAAAELYRSFSQRAFCASLQRLVPEIQNDDLEEGGAGVRAQAMFPNGNLVEDFLLVHQGAVLHVVNAPSPAATSSLAIGAKIVETVTGSMNC